MSQENPTGLITLTAGAAIKRFRRVMLSSGKLAAAGATDRDIGTLEHESFADGDLRTVKLANFPGTRRMVAAGAIAVGAEVFTAADGKVDDVGGAGTYRIGWAVTEASADLDIIEVAIEHYELQAA